MLVVYLISWYSLGAHASGWQMWVGAGFVLVGVVEFVVTDGSRFSVADVPFALAMVGGPWAAGVTLQLMRGRERSLTAENAELERAKEEEARRAVASERARLARELHDVVSHAISVTVLQARGGRRLVGVDDRAVIDALDAIVHTNTAALGDMRRLLAVLRDADDPAVARQAPQPTLARLGELVDQVRHSGLPVLLDQEGIRETVPPGVDLSAYRIIQEALTNVLKHGGEGVSARVRVAYGADRLRLEVSDDGCGAPAQAAGHGLLGIRERVAVIGGAVQAGPGPDGGYVVSAELPYSTKP
jgi:signal transduction histidine kinase